MNVVRQSNNPNHQARIIPREYIEAAYLLIRDKEQNGEFVSQEVECTEDNGYLLFDFTYTFRQDATYDFIVNDQDDNLIFRGQFFSTNLEDLANYRVI